MKIITTKIESAKLNNYNDNFSSYLLNNKNISSSFIFFSFIKENFFCCSFDKSISINKTYISFLNFIKESFIDNKYNLLLYWQHYIIISLISEIKNLLLEKQIKEINNCSFSELNKIIYLLNQNNIIIIHLYHKAIINIKEIIKILNIFIFWARDGYKLIDTEIIVFDLFYKLKNYFIYTAYFDLIKNIFLLEMKFLKEENNLTYIFDH